MFKNQWAIILMLFSFSFSALADGNGDCFIAGEYRVFDESSALQWSQDLALDSTLSDRTVIVNVIPVEILSQMSDVERRVVQSLVNNKRAAVLELQADKDDRLFMTVPQDAEWFGSDRVIAFYGSYLGTSLEDVVVSHLPLIQLFHTSDQKYSELKPNCHF